MELIEFDDNLTLSSSTTQKPVLTLENANDAISAFLNLLKIKEQQVLLMM